jgi:hypothetical protein
MHLLKNIGWLVLFMMWLKQNKYKKQKQNKNYQLLVQQLLSNNRGAPVML